MIAVDWGTSSLRLYRMDEGGKILESRRSDKGVLASEGRFADVLLEASAGWDDGTFLMCGMIGSRNGWHEMPYLDCPSGNAALAAGMQRIHPSGFDGRALWLVPGLCDKTSESVPDVMRGEETQLAALLDHFDDGPHLVCLPGTHSKWVTVHERRIQHIATAMTGELFALLRQHSILGRLMAPDSGPADIDIPAFDAGLQRSADPGGLLHHLFGVRTAGLFVHFSEPALPSYLSGLLIGHELRAANVLSRSPRPAQVHLIGHERLLASYAHALATLGISARRHPETLAAHGLHALWRQHLRETTD